MHRRPNKVLTRAVILALISSTTLVYPPAVVAQQIGFQPGVGPICASPMGPLPCAQIPPPGPFPSGPPGFPPGPMVIPVPTGTPQDIAIRCAHDFGTDLNSFAACTGRQVILPQRDQELLDCAVDSAKAEDFAVCAAPKFGIRLTHDQQVVADCAMQSNGDTDDFASCAAPRLAMRG